MKFHKCDICNCDKNVYKNIDIQIITTQSPPPKGMENMMHYRSLYYTDITGCKRIRRHLENVKIHICDNCLIKRLEGKSIFKEGRNPFFA